MKKAIIGVTAVGAVVALRPRLKRRMVQKMQKHCVQMMGHFAGGETTGRETIGPEAARHKMREQCEEMAAQHEARREPAATA